MIFKNPEKAQDYPVLNEYTSFLRPMKRDLIGRKGEMSEVLSAFERVEVSNVMLLGYAGSGKTALIDALKILKLVLTRIRKSSFLSMSSIRSFSCHRQQ